MRVATRRSLLSRPAAAATAVSWWLASGTIAEANVYEHVELPSAGQSYAGSTIANNLPYTIVFRTTDSTATQFVFDFNGNPGRIACGYVPGNGFIESQWWGSVTNSLFSSGDHVYYLVVSAAQVATWYRDNVQVGSTYTNWSTGVDGTNGARWRSLFNNAGANNWTPDLTYAAVYNVALDSTQRSALYTAMSA